MVFNGELHAPSSLLLGESREEAVDWPPTLVLLRGVTYRIGAEVVLSKLENSDYNGMHAIIHSVVWPGERVCVSIPSAGKMLSVLPTSFVPAVLENLNAPQQDPTLYPGADGQYARATSTFSCFTRLIVSTLDCSSMTETLASLSARVAETMEAPHVVLLTTWSRTPQCWILAPALQSSPHAHISGQMHDEDLSYQQAVHKHNTPRFRTYHPWGCSTESLYMYQFGTSK